MMVETDLQYLIALVLQVALAHISQKVLAINNRKNLTMLGRTERHKED